MIFYGPGQHADPHEVGGALNKRTLEAFWSNHQDILESDQALIKILMPFGESSQLYVEVDQQKATFIAYLCRLQAIP